MTPVREIKTSASMSASMIRGLIDNDPKKWSEFVERYGTRIYGVCRQHNLGHEDAQDITQEIYLTIYQRIQTYIARPKPGSFRAWLHKAVLNKLIDRHRTRRPRVAAELEYARESLVDTCDRLHEDDWDDEQFRSQIWPRVQAIAPSTELEVFSRLVFSGQSASEVAESLALTIAVVYVYKSRVLEMCKAVAREMGILIRGFPWTAEYPPKS